METPAELKYAKTDEWVRIEGDLAVIGIKNSQCATVESVKAAADVNFPVSGELVEINEALSTSPELLNTDPFGKAWILKVKISDPADLNDLMDSVAYIKYCESRH
jgi:glycine cleavage system H protein